MSRPRKKVPPCRTPARMAAACSRYYQKLRKAGLCTACRSVVGSDHSLCDKCRQKARVRLKHKRKLAMSLAPELRPCSHCLRRAPSPGRRTCLACRKEATQKRKENPGARAADLAERHRLRVEHGLCIECSVNDAAPQRSRCIKCLERDRARHAALRASRRAAAEAEGRRICSDCQIRVPDGEFKECAICRRRNMEERQNRRIERFIREGAPECRP